DGDYTLGVMLAPPLLARRGPDGVPRKMRFGRWVFPVFRGLAALRRVRGTLLDPFGHTLERRCERALADDYAAMIDALVRRLGEQGPEAAARLGQALQLAAVPQSIRGFGHVKLRSLVEAKRREAQLAASLGLAPRTSAPVSRAIAEAR